MGADRTRPRRERHEPAPDHVHDALSTASGGAAPAEPTRVALEQGIGHSFGELRIHADAEADELARELDARALASGDHVYFRAGEYAPETPEGLRVLAHEAAHVAQQSRGEVSGSADGALRVVPSEDHTEAEADAAADAVVAGVQTGPTGGETSSGAGAGAVVQLWPWDDDDSGGGGGGGGGGGVIEALTEAASPVGSMLSGAIGQIASDPVAAVQSGISGAQQAPGILGEAAGIAGGYMNPLAGTGIGDAAAGWAGSAIDTAKSVSSGVAGILPDPIGAVTDAGTALGGVIDDPAGALASAEGSVSSAASTALDWGNKAGNAVNSAESTVWGGLSSAWGAASGAYNKVMPDFTKANADLGKLVDMGEGAVHSGTQAMVDATSGIPVLGTLAEGAKFLGDTSADLTGGTLKGAGDLTSAAGNALIHPLDSAAGMAKGALGMAEHGALAGIPGLGTTLKGLHGSYDILSGNTKGEYGASWSELGNNLISPEAQGKDDLKYWAGIGGGEEVWKAKPAEALSRTLTNLAPMALGAGEGMMPEGAIPGEPPVGGGLAEPTPMPESPISPAAESVPSPQVAPAEPAISPAAESVPAPENAPQPAQTRNPVQQMSAVDPDAMASGTANPGDFVSGPVGSFDLVPNEPIPPTEMPPTEMPPTEMPPTQPQAPGGPTYAQVRGGPPIGPDGLPMSGAVEPAGPQFGSDAWAEQLPSASPPSAGPLTEVGGPNGFDMNPPGTLGESELGVATERTPATLPGVGPKTLPGVAPPANPFVPGVVDPAIPSGGFPPSSFPEVPSFPAGEFPAAPEAAPASSPNTYAPNGSRADWAWNPSDYPGDLPPSTPPGFEGQPRPYPVKQPSPGLPDFGQIDDVPAAPESGVPPTLKTPFAPDNVPLPAKPRQIPVPQPAEPASAPGSTLRSPGAGFAPGGDWMTGAWDRFAGMFG